MAVVQRLWGGEVVEKYSHVEFSCTEGCLLEQGLFYAEIDFVVVREPIQNVQCLTLLVWKGHLSDRRAVRQLRRFTHLLLERSSIKKKIIFYQAPRILYHRGRSQGIPAIEKRDQ